MNGHMCVLKTGWEKCLCGEGGNDTDKALKANLSHFPSC